jgi:hypothetical protein
MMASPEQEDVRRRNRDRENLVGKRTRIVNRMKSTLARLGIRGFKPNLRRAPERLDRLRTGAKSRALGSIPRRERPVEIKAIPRNSRLSLGSTGR